MRTKQLDALAVRAQIIELFTDLPVPPEMRDLLDLHREMNLLMTDLIQDSPCSHKETFRWNTSEGEERCGLCGRAV